MHDHLTDRSYVALAKGFSPHIPPVLMEYIVGVYVHMRAEEKVCTPHLQIDRQDDHASTYTSPRALLSILRLSTALVRPKRVIVDCRPDCGSASRSSRLTWRRRCACRT